VRGTNLPIIEDVLALLEDGEWHSLKEIRDKNRLLYVEAKSLTDFLARYNIVRLDEGEENVRINHPTLDFLKKIQKVEEEELPQANL
jgi:hypothetical protein